MAKRFRHEDISATPGGWRVRTVKHGDHRVRVAFPPGRKQNGAGRLVSLLHPLSGKNPCGGVNPCTVRSANPAELLIMGANPPRRSCNATHMQIEHDTARRQFRATMPHPHGGSNLYAWGDTKKIAAARLRDEWRQARKNNPKRQATQLQKEHKKALRMAMAARHAWGSAKTDAQRHKADQDLRTWTDKARDLWDQIHRAGNNPAELLIMGANPRVEVVHGDNPPVEEIVEAFSGTPAEWVDVYNEPLMQRGRYAKLGELLNLYIKPAAGGQVQKITFGSGREAPIVVCDSTARQIYFVGGNQDISGALSAFGLEHASGTVKLGEGRRIDYKARKEHVADPEEDRWKHDHGEENGAKPTVLFDTHHKKLLYEGGDYRIDGAWIRN